jgi:hypothetical protein
VLEERAQASADQTFDVFLSHSYGDAMKVNADDLLRLKVLLESHGISVYVDWIVDGNLSRDRVTTATASIIRHRLDNCKSLLYVTSSTSSNSKWMPWELGYKDGASKRAAILPIVDRQADKFHGQEYLGLYPYVTRAPNTSGKKLLWIEASNGDYVSFNEWLTSGTRPYRHSS